MRIPELLAPAGSFEAMVAAVNNGCDAVYLAGNRFGARGFAANFSEEQLIEAIQYCHIRGVKVYVTVNTLIYEEEIAEVIKTIDFLYAHDADALIIQDLGLLEIISKCYHDFEIHASTQMHCHNLEGVKFLKECGVKRVVMARESPIELIEACTNQGIEIEVFVQGAQCVCYSGQCLMSSFIGNRSGNRGECAQPCRLPYRLIEETENIEIETKGSYLLSPKDLNTLNQIDALIEAGIDSFKIEGRMKRPEYVGYTVSLWRKAIDEYFSSKKQSYDNQAELNLKKLFNRGFSAGHLFNQKGLNLMNPQRPNHLGIEIGVVLQAGAEKIKIRLTHELNQQDGIRILGSQKDVGFAANKIYKNDYLVNHANAGDIIELDCDGYIEKGSIVLKTTDIHQMDELRNQNLIGSKKVGVTLELEAFVNQPLTLYLTDGEHSVIVKSDELIQVAQKSPVTPEKIHSIIEKCKDTPYFIKTLELKGDESIFISLASIGELRRRGLENLSEKRKIRHPGRPLPLQYIAQFEATGDFVNQVIIHREDQLNTLVKQPHEDLFVEGERLYAHLNKSCKGVYYRYPRVHEQSPFIESEKILIQDLGALQLYQNHPNVIADASFNVTNSYALAFLNQHQVQGVVLSHELNETQIVALKSAFEKRYSFKANIGIMSWGYREAMISKYCVINTLLKDGQKTNCALCKGNKQYSLVNEKNDHFTIMSDESCFNHLLEPTRLIRADMEGVGKQICYNLETNLWENN